MAKNNFSRSSLFLLSLLTLFLKSQFLRCETKSQYMISDIQLCCHYKIILSFTNISRFTASFKLHILEMWPQLESFNVGLSQENIIEEFLGLVWAKTFIIQGLTLDRTLGLNNSSQTQPSSKALAGAETELAKKNYLKTFLNKFPILQS